MTRNISHRNRRMRYLLRIPILVILGGSLDLAVDAISSRSRMNQRPTILVFDSGVGGLTVFREVVKARPDASYVYIADDAFFPYAQRSEAELVSRVVPAESLHGEAEAFALKLAAGPTRAFAAVKSLLRAYERAAVLEADKITVATVMPLMDSNDAVAAVTALMSTGPKPGPTTFTGA